MAIYKSGGKQADNQTDIEIISESASSAITTNSTNAANSSMQHHQLTAAATFQYNSDETFKNYLSKTYQTSVTVAAKPQSNFISNLSCINQILVQLTGTDKTDYYENKLRRCKPYSSVKPKDILEMEDDDEEDDENESEDNSEGEESEKKRARRANKLKAKKIIVIDDTNEEMHKPWITPELIKLIKHRNLLQAKINENNLNVSAANVSTMTAADDELVKKFKNLRNKVTKLVKKARSKLLWL